MDATTITVLGAVAVAFVSASATVAVAFINNWKERSSSAGAGMEAVLQQRIEFGEDRLEAAGLDLARKDELIRELRNQLATCTCRRTSA